MYCTCNERHQWVLNDCNLSSSNATLPRRSHENLNFKKSALKPTTIPGKGPVRKTPKKTVKTVDSNHLGPRSSTLPRSRSRAARPHVATIFNHNNELHRERRQSEVIPWHKKSSIAQQCTCRSSCYFCNLNYPKFPQVSQLSASTNALGYYFPYSTLSLNNPTNYPNRSGAPSKNSSSQYLYNDQQRQTQAFQELPLLNPPQLHHHSMINLNYSSQTDPMDNNVNQPLLNPSSPTMSNSPVPEPPAPPLNPRCARCRFTSSISATVTSNGNLHHQQIVGSNPHMQQQVSNINSATSTGATGNPTTYLGELFSPFLCLFSEYTDCCVNYWLVYAYFNWFFIIQ